VVIPAANQADLMLRQDVRDAVAAGKFRVFAARHADQVLALLTGMPAGAPDANGLYPENSCNGRIQLRLFEWTALRQHYSSGGDNGN
jgi:predicted ATP-dependent protease